MALSTAVFVGEAKEWIPDLVERAKKLTVNAGKSKCDILQDFFLWRFSLGYSKFWGCIDTPLFESTDLGGSMSSE